MMCGHIEQGYFNDTNLDGLDYAVLMSWPGEVAEGNGTQQVIISQLADPTQREALRARRIRSTASVPFIRDTSHTATIEFQVKYQSVEMRSGWAAMINSN
jgi:hypothetical protein